MYSYSAVYGDPLINAQNNPYPDGLLQQLSHNGINGVWLQGVLYTLVPWSVAPELSAGWEKRVENLRKLCIRAADFNIGVYLYLNELRAMPDEFFRKCPEWKDTKFKKRETWAVCTSSKGVLELLSARCKKLFENAPELSGVFTISMSENPTHCISKGTAKISRKCPRCSQRSAHEIVAEVNSSIEAGIHSVKPDARVIVWTGGMGA